MGGLGKVQKCADVIYGPIWSHMGRGHYLFIIGEIGDYKKLMKRKASKSFSCKYPFFSSTCFLA